MIYDCVVIGQGPAGLTAAIYLKRANKNVLSVGKDLGVLGTGIKIENYYGYGSTDSKKIASASFNHAKSLGIPLITGEVLSIEHHNNDTYAIKTKTDSYVSKTILLATGANRVKLNIPGFKKYDRKGIYYCVTCDGYFLKNKKIALIGSGDYMLRELEDLKNITVDITVFTNGEKFDKKVNANVVTEKITEFIGNDEQISEIKTEKGEYHTDGVFIAIGSPGATDFARKLGLITDNDIIVVGDDYQTNVAGIFGAGDIIGGKMQVTKAAYNGMMAAGGIIEYLKK